MDEPGFQIFLCQRASCGFRFHIPAGRLGSVRCPRCNAIAQPVELIYQPARVIPRENPFHGPQVEVILDNIRSTLNVGSMFRTADGAGLRHLHLCGLTPTPANPKVTKTALGAELSISWTYHTNSLAAVMEMKAAGMRLWALEGGPDSHSIFEAISDLRDNRPLALVVGNEVSGVDPGILSQCKRIVSIPMQGVKGSLNVSVAFGIAVYLLRYGMPPNR